MNRNLRLFLTALLSAANSGCLAPALAETAPQTAYVAPAHKLSSLLQGKASVTNDIWVRYFESGSQALDKRFYEQAARRLNSALDELRRRNVTDVRLIQTREALGRTYLGLERYGDAERVLTDAIERAGKLGNEAAGAKARAAQALAETLLAQHKYQRAETVARQALDYTQHAGVNEPRAVGRAYMTLADALAAGGLDAESGDLYKKAIAVLGRDGLDQLDLADAEYHYAILLRAQSNEGEATSHFEKAFAIYDQACQPNKPLSHAPHLVIRWEEGSPRARVVPDQDYPLKYVIIDGIRVSATLVRSENVIVALVSVSNCGRNRKELSIGQVSLEQKSPKHKPFRWVHPSELDTALEAEHVTELTWRRRWLNHIEKTRRIPGYLKDGVLDVDNFFGNNQFTDRYGSWQTVARTETPIVTREQFLYSPYREATTTTHDSADFLSHTPVGTHPTYLDAGDSKTGLVYFQQERFDKALLKVVIGNTIVEIPFDSAGPR